MTGQIREATLATCRAATRLAELGCDTLQGFSIGRPMPTEALERWLRERGSPIGPRVRRTRVTRLRPRASGGVPAA